VFVLVLAASAELDHHETGPGHPERPERLRAALDGIAVAGLTDAVLQLAPRRATEDELARVHDRTYLATLEAFCADSGGALDPDTVAVRGSWDTALLAAGGGLAAVEALEAGRGDVAFVAVRPPGHHATGNKAMGFCLINNVAVAAAALADRGERVAIVDWDVHHGNGTQDLFWDDPRVLFVSTHEWPLYPGSGRAEETGGANAPGLTVNIPLPAGATGDVLLATMDTVVAPIVDRFAPTWVLVSAGFDAHRDDPLADLRLSAGDFSDLMARVQRFAPRSGRLALFLEGGYDLEALRQCVGAVLSTALGGRYRPESATAGGPGADAVEVARRVHATLA
jgi:acetoin utilization deacetylase AcuC-like enzyme